MSRAKKLLMPDDPRHGTENGYSNLDCRCGPCTEAHRIHYHEVRVKRPGYRERKNARERARYAARRES